MPTATPTSILLPVVPTAQPERAEDIVLLNGNVLTIDSADTITQALAIKEGIFQVTGTTEQVSAVVGESTQIIDLSGTTVTPGMIDAHNHFQVVGLLMDILSSLDYSFTSNFFRCLLSVVMLVCGTGQCGCSSTAPDLIFDLNPAPPA